MVGAPIFAGAAQLCIGAPCKSANRARSSFKMNRGSVVLKLRNRGGWIIFSTSRSRNCQTSSGLSQPDLQRKNKYMKRVFFLDVNPICYNGNIRSLRSFSNWISLFFSEVTHRDPVIAVIDGENSNEYRRQLLPSYKAHRRNFSIDLSTSQRFSRSHVGKTDTNEIISKVLDQCNVPVLRIDGEEADDVVATLVAQVLQTMHSVVIASPDKDFKQLICEHVQMVMPMPEFNRWYFYTLKHYRAQYNCDPYCDLSLRSMVGDEGDGVPGIQDMVPGFGRKTVLKLLKKHGSLENLLNAAAVRTVGKPYAQDALTKYADFLRRNYQVLALKRDVDIHLKDEWLHERDNSNDSVTLSNLFKLLGESKSNKQQYIP